MEVGKSLIMDPDRSLTIWIPRSGFMTPDTPYTARTKSGYKMASNQVAGRDGVKVRVSRFTERLASLRLFGDERIYEDGANAQ